MICDLVYIFHAERPSYFTLITLDPMVYLPSLFHKTCDYTNYKIIKMSRNAMGQLPTKQPSDVKNILSTGVMLPTTFSDDPIPILITR